MNNVIFMHNSSASNVVDKSTSNILTCACDFIDDCTILNPTLKIKYNSSLLTANYCYIPVYNRYYYITDIITSRGYLYIKCRVDVLMSHKNAIRNNAAIIKRQQYKYNTYLPDDRLPAYAYEILSAYAFGTPFTKDSIAYLTLLGGAEVNSAHTP